MRDLEYALRQLVDRSREGSRSTQHRRKSELSLMARQLRAAGYDRLRDPADLKGRHVTALVERWKADGLKDSSMKTRMATLRWWARHVGKASVVPRSNSELGIGRRLMPDNSVNRAKTLTAADLGRIRDPYVRMSVQLAYAFGLRGEEAMKIRPWKADHGAFLRLDDSWTKGKVGRDIPIRTPEQRAVLDRAKEMARHTPRGSLIPTETYREHRNTYRSQTYAAGLAGHDYRHDYAQRRYAELTGWPCPRAGGPTVRDLTAAQRAVDHAARMTIAAEMGHGREYVTVVYLGR